MQKTLRSFIPVLALGLALPWVAAAPAAAAGADVITVGTVTANNFTVDVPVYIRDVSTTPLGVDQPAGQKIQSFSMKVDYSPAASVSSVTFTRAGVTQTLTPTFENSPSSPGSVSLIDTFNEATNPIPFTLNAAAPGNQVAHLTFHLSNSVAPGSTITLSLDPTVTQLSNQGGTTSETTALTTLSLVNGSIAIPLVFNIPATSSLTLALLALALAVIAVRSRL